MKAAQKSGMKVMVGEGILDFVSPSGMGPEETLAQTAAWAKKYKNDSNISVAVAPHSPYTVSEKWLLKAAEMSESLDIPYHIHMAVMFHASISMEKRSILKKKGLPDLILVIYEKRANRCSAQFESFWTRNKL